MTEIKHVGDADFEEQVLKSERPVLVDFWATWCGPCKMVAPEIERLAARFGDTIDVVKFDVDANPMVSQALNIMSIPTVALFAPGEAPRALVGFRTAEQMTVQLGLERYAPAKV